MKQIWRSLGFACLLAAVLVILLKYVFPVLLPFAVAGLMALMIDPAVDWLEARGKFKRGLAVAAVLSLVLSLAVYLLGFAVAKLFTELAALAGRLPEYYRAVSSALDTILSRYTQLVTSLPPPVTNAFQAALANLYQALERLVHNVLMGLGKVPGAAAMIAVGGVATFFISRDKRELGRFLMTLVPRAHRGKLLEVKGEVVLSLFGFIRAQLFLIAVSTATTLAGLLILRVDYALLLAIIIGILDLLPMVGPGIALVPWALWSLATGQPGLGIGLLVLYAVVFLVRQFLEVKIIGERMGLHPLAILLSIYLGLRLLGPVGLVIGPVTAVVVRAAVRSGLIPLFPGADEL